MAEPLPDAAIDAIPPTPSVADAAPQHKPRPLPLFLELLRSETAASPQRLATALRGLRAYQNAPRNGPLVPVPEVARAGRAGLRDYGGYGPPLVIVPSLINPPDVLDLDGGRSLLRWLSRQGVRPLLVDWGVPEPEESALGIDGHVEALLLPLLDAVGEPPLLAGYCLGGTMALAAATLRPVRGLATIAAPWRFTGFPEAARADVRALWRTARPLVERLGLFPMELLQTLFWRLDPARIVGKFERLADLPADGEEVAEFVRLEDWANDGPPLTAAAGRELMEDMFEADMTGSGGWAVGGVTIDPARLSCPILEIASSTDRIVPLASAHGYGTQLVLDLGHVGMVVGRRARAAMWEPLAGWLREVAKPF